MAPDPAAALGAEDERVQREIWMRQCPVLLAERDRFCEALERIASLAQAEGSSEIAHRVYTEACNALA